MTPQRLCRCRLPLPEQEAETRNVFVRQGTEVQNIALRTRTKSVTVTKSSTQGCLRDEGHRSVDHVLLPQDKRYGEVDEKSCDGERSGSAATFRRNWENG